jgi:hypothetical protein
LAIGLWSLYAVTLVLAIRFSVISSPFRLKWRWIHQLIIRMPNWFWFPKKRCRTLSWIRFHQRNGIQQPWIEANCTHTNSHMWPKNTRWIFYSSNYWKPFWFNPIFIFTKAIQLNHFLADEKVVNNNVPFYNNLYAQKANENPTFYLASNLNYLITKNDYHDDKTTSSSKSIAKKIILIPLFTGPTIFYASKQLHNQQMTRILTIWG